MRLSIPALLGAALFLLAPLSQAQSPVRPAGSRIDRAQHRQAHRIRQGVRSGEITPREANRLGREQARIRRHERRMKSDGAFTPRERARLGNELTRSSRHIFRARHNRF